MIAFFRVNLGYATVDAYSFYYCLMGLKGSFFLGVDAFLSVVFLDWNRGDIVSFMVYLLDLISSSIISSYSSSSLISTLSFWTWSLWSFKIPLLISFYIYSYLFGNFFSYYYIFTDFFYFYLRTSSSLWPLIYNFIY